MLSIIDMSTGVPRTPVPQTHGISVPSPGWNTYVGSACRKYQPQVSPLTVVQPETASLKLVACPHPAVYNEWTESPDCCFISIRASCPPKPSFSVGLPVDSLIPISPVSSISKLCL